MSRRHRDFDRRDDIDRLHDGIDRPHDDKSRRDVSHRVGLLDLPQSKPENRLKQRIITVDQIERKYLQLEIFK